MAHTPFMSLYPDLGRKETRTIHIPRGHPSGIPAGKYGFIELYCTDIGCDCRNAYIHVVRSGETKPLAILNYGWESLKYYKAWMGGGKEAETAARTLKGVSLGFLQAQSKYADKFLDIFKEMLKNRGYRERFKAHYGLFKYEINKNNGHKARNFKNTKIGRNDPCSCGSGLKYKKCCLRKTDQSER